MIIINNYNIPQVFMVDRLINHTGCWKNRKRIHKSLTCGSWYTNSSSVLLTSQMVYHSSKQIHEFDWLKLTLTAVGIFWFRPASGPVTFCIGKKLQTKIQKFLQKISIHQNCQKDLIRKKSKEGKQPLADLSSVHWLSQAKCQLVQTSDIKQKNPCFPYNKHLLNQA